MAITTNLKMGWFLLDDDRLFLFQTWWFINQGIKQILKNCVSKDFRTIYIYVDIDDIYYIYITCRHVMGKNEQQLEQRKAYSLYGLWEPWSWRDREIARMEVVGRCVFSHVNLRVPPLCHRKPPGNSRPY